MGEIRGQTGGGGKVGKKGDSVTAVLRGEREGSTVSNLFFSHLSGHPLSPWPRFTVYTSYSDIRRRKRKKKKEEKKCCNVAITCRQLRRK